MNATNLKGYQRTMMTMCENAEGGEVHCANPEDKRAATALEKKGLVTIRRTDVRMGGLLEWWVTLAAKAGAA
jgi:hypothetical protein